jgi:hypothetical protein
MAAALKRAERRFARIHPDWSASCFDEHFLFHHVLQLGDQTPGGLSRVPPEKLAEAWFRQVTVSQTTRQLWARELTLAAAEFLRLYTAELQEQARPLDSELQVLNA